MQSDYAWPTMIFVVLAALSVAADWWRHRNRDAYRTRGRITWIPWPLISILSLIAAAVCAAHWIGGN